MPNPSNLAMEEQWKKEEADKRATKKERKYNKGTYYEHARLSTLSTTT